MVSSMIDARAKKQWFLALATAAQIAGDDPERCMALVNQMRIVRGLVAELSYQSKQDGFVGGIDAGVSQDGFFDSHVGAGLEGNPTQVA
jgi:hypothetical protein